VVTENWNRRRRERKALDFSGKFCPVCKHKNERDAALCSYCGAALQAVPTDGGVTTRTTELDAAIAENARNAVFDAGAVPPGGIAIYMDGSAQPAFACRCSEFVIGRKMDETPEVYFDLTHRGGYLLGLSRRHARVRRNGSGFEITDLASTNGSWLNGERLIPNQPYPLDSGAQLRLGRMRFYVLFRPVAETRQKVQKV
jgi:hypothetical protein